MSIKDQRGFTLVEIAIIAPLMIMVALGIVGILISLVSATVGPNARSILMQQEEKSFDSIESDVNSSAGLISSLPANFSDSASGDYSSPPSGTSVLMIKTFDQIADSSDSSSTRTIPAFKGSSPCTNTTDLNSTNIAQIVVVYYVKNNSLYRRTLTDTSTPTTCGTKLAQQTCLTCTYKDLQLLSADGISQFSITYYTTITGNTTTTDPTAAKSALITITSSLNAGGDAQQYTAALRVSRLN